MLSFFVPKGANGSAGDGFFSVLVKYVAKWVDASAENIPGIVVSSVNNPTVSVMCYALVLRI